MKQRCIWYWPIVLLLAMVVGLTCGCGVTMSPKYSALLDKTVVLSDAAAINARQLEPNVALLQEDVIGTNAVLHRLQDARDGKDANGVK